MIFHELQALPASYRHVYLAPHLDDAALSCGGAIAAQVEAGEPALVVTLCTAAPPPDGPFSALALEFHAEWGLAPDAVVAARLQEEQAALAALGADGFWAGMLDAIYRHPGAYHARSRLFGAPDPADPLLPAVRACVVALRERLPGAQFYAPLGVGSHVDHLLTHRAAAEALGAEACFYEDFPYVARPGALAERLAALDGELQPAELPIAAQLDRKLAAVRAYASQLAELAHSQLGRSLPAPDAADAFAAAVASYARLVGGGSPAERIWRIL